MPTTETSSPQMGKIHALLAERGYQISETAPDTIRIQEAESGVAIQGVLEGDILYLSLLCTAVPAAAVTPEMMALMLDARNGVSTSYFQIFDAGAGKTGISLNNFCKLQDLGADDEDDILSCVNFLLVDVMSARRLLSGLKA